MPRPTRYTPRSSLGWSPNSPGAYADPQQGLVVHYDSNDQNLADQAHSACVDYWQWCRDFHVNGRGWSDVGYCVDEETEILTADGWKDFRRIRSGDTVLTLNHETAMSQWQPLTDVHIFPAMRREMIRMDGRSHSSLTTAQHRWPAERFYRRAGTRRQKSADGKWAATGRTELTQQGRERVWATTETLTYWDRIPLSAPCVDLPTEPKWSDALVELVAWFWTEGHIRPQSRSRLPSTGVVIYQSEQKNPENVARIRGALHALLGPPCDSFPRAGSAADGTPRWREARNRHLVEFHLSVDAGRLLIEQAPDRVPIHTFLCLLTRAQLELFIQVSLLADGHNNHTVNAKTLSQKSKAAAEAFQFAVTLAGYATSLRRRPPTASTDYDMWKVELRRKTHFSPKAAATRKSAFTITREPYEGHIWCPQTSNATWMARREGTVYFTGNSYMACPHGYVLEGRGLFTQQAAQRGYNDDYYSATLACGPTDEITPAQVEAVRQLRAWLMEPESSISSTVLGHRDLNDTSCPGDTAYRMVRDGTFAQPPTGFQEVDDVPTYVSVDKNGESRHEELSSGQWRQVHFNQNNSEGAHGHHAEGDYPSLVVGPAYLQGDVSLRITGLPAGTPAQIRAIEVTNEDGDGYEITEHYYPAEFTGTGGDSYPKVPITGYVGEGHKLRVEVAQFGADGAEPVVVGGQARIQVWEL